MENRRVIIIGAGIGGLSAGYWLSQRVSFVSDIFGGCLMEAAMVSAAEAVKRVCGWGGTA